MVARGVVVAHGAVVEVDLPARRDHALLAVLGPPPSTLTNRQVPLVATWSRLLRANSNYFECAESLLWLVQKKLAGWLAAVCRSRDTHTCFRFLCIKSRQLDFFFSVLLHHGPPLTQVIHTFRSGSSTVCCCCNQELLRRKFSCLSAGRFAKKNNGNSERQREQKRFLFWKNNFFFC